MGTTAVNAVRVALGKFMGDRIPPKRGGLCTGTGRSCSRCYIIAVYRLLGIGSVRGRGRNEGGAAGGDRGVGIGEGGGYAKGVLPSLQQRGRLVLLCARAATVAHRGAGHRQVSLPESSMRAGPI